MIGLRFSFGNITKVTAIRQKERGNQTALDAFKHWWALWPDAKPGDYIFPNEKLVFKRTAAVVAETMTHYAADRSKPQGSWKTAWNTAKKRAGVECRVHDLPLSFISALAQTQTPMRPFRPSAAIAVRRCWSITAMHD